MNRTNFSGLNWEWTNIFQNRSVRRSWLHAWRPSCGAQGKADASEQLSAGGIVIDKAAHMVTIDGKSVELSFKEFELLTYFMENEGSHSPEKRF